MAATSSRRGRRTNTKRATQNGSNRDNSALRQRIANWQKQGREILNELFFSAADSALDVTQPLSAPVRVTSRSTSTEIVEPAAAATPRRRRGRAAATSTTRAPANATDGRRRRTRTVDTSNLGRGDRVIDRVFNALPPSGAINRAALQQIVERDMPGVKPQAIGSAIAALETARFARRNGDVIERLRAAA